MSSLPKWTQLPVFDRKDDGKMLVRGEDILRLQEALSIAWEALESIKATNEPFRDRKGDLYWPASHALDRIASLGDTQQGEEWK